MKRSYADEHVSRHLKDCFIPVVIDADKNERLVASVGVEALPTTVIVSPDLKILKRITGYKTPKQLEKDLGELCGKRHRTQTPRVVARMKSPVARNFAYGNYCLVSLLEQRLLKQGNAEHTSTFDGNLVCFASAQHKERFDANPETYWPVMNGGCSVTAVEKGISHAGLPDFGAVYHGRLWFFADEAHRERFAMGPERYMPIRTR
jgi:YHS domain-containing protein